MHPSSTTRFPSFGGALALFASLASLASVVACTDDDAEARGSDAESEDAGPVQLGHDAALDPGEGATPAATDASNDGSTAGAIQPLQLTVGELVFDALAAGPEDGDLVLLFHGFPETSFEWRSQLTALGAAGYRAVAPDQRGYSPGARPTDVESYGIVKLIGDAIGMADALGYEHFHVVGHDWGGGVAWGLAGVVPARVTTVTVLSTPHPAALSSALADHTSCQYGASAYFDTLSKPDSSAADLATIGVGFDGVPEEAQKEYIGKIISKPDVLDAALNWYRANVSGRNLTGTIGAITVPTLYLWGTSDATFCRETAEDSAQYVTGPYRFVPVEGAGHWLAESASDVVNREILSHLEN